MILVVVAACNLDERIRKRGEDLTEELTDAAVDFNRMITWRYFDDAVGSVIPDSRANFLMWSEQVYQRVHMEGYKVTLVQVATEPFPRVRGEVAPPPSSKKAEGEQPFSFDEPPKDAKPEKGAVKSQKNQKMPKTWYGLVLVRFVNLTVVPYNKVRSPLLRQYWYYRESEKVWRVDPDIDQLLELGNPDAAPPPPTQ
jgi:hypothetical protein